MIKDIPPKASVAERLKVLRNAIGLTRKEMEANHNVKSASLISWEKSHRIPKKDKVELLVSIFKNYGISCTADWILNGNGSNPLEQAAKNPEETYLLQEISRFQSFYKDSLVIEVEDQSMSPWINTGDFVGGVFVDPKEEKIFINQISIVKIRGFGTQIRLVKKSSNDQLYNLTSFSNKGDILNVELEAVARIVFLRKK